MVKSLPAMQETWVGKIPGGREWQPTPIFLHGEFHGQRSLMGYSPRGHKESDTTEWLIHTHVYTFMLIHVWTTTTKDIYVYVFTHPYIYIYIYVCVCVCVCVFPHRNKELFWFFSYQNIQFHLNKAKYALIHLELTSFLFLWNRHFLSSTIYSVSIKQRWKTWSPPTTVSDPGNRTASWNSVDGVLTGWIQACGARCLPWSDRFWLPRSRVAAPV